MAITIKDLVPSIEKVRMVNSGTEATMSAVRLARGFTKRDKVIKFEGATMGMSIPCWSRRAVARSRTVLPTARASRRLLPT